MKKSLCISSTWALIVGLCLVIVPGSLGQEKPASDAANEIQHLKREVEKLRKEIETLRLENQQLKKTLADREQKATPSTAPRAGTTNATPGGDVQQPTVRNAPQPLTH